MGMTMTQKILAKHAGLDSVTAGQLIEANVDLTLANDITGPVAIREMEKAGFSKVFDNTKIALVMDHFAPNKDIKSAEQCLECREFSKKYNIVNFFDVGAMGIEHALLPEKGLTAPGELIIGASDTVTKTYLLSRLEAFHKDYPDIRIRILNGTTSMVLDYLHAGQVDIAFASEAPDETVYSVRHCVDTHTIFVAAPDYLEFDKVYTMEEIAALPLILLERKASSRVYVERYFQEHGVQIHPEIELGSHNLLISLARIGLGVACVTEEFSLSGLSRGVIVPLKTDFEIPPRAVTMCTLQGVTPTSAANRFMDFITETNRMAYDPGHSYHFTNS